MGLFPKRIRVSAWRSAISSTNQLSFSSSIPSPRTASSSSMIPATAETGYRLSPEPLPNPFTSDKSFQRILACKLHFIMPRYYGISVLTHRKGIYQKTYSRKLCQISRDLLMRQSQMRSNSSLQTPRSNSHMSNSTTSGASDTTTTS